MLDGKRVMGNPEIVKDVVHTDNGLFIFHVYVDRDGDGRVRIATFGYDCPNSGETIPATGPVNESSLLEYENKTLERLNAKRIMQ